MHLSELSLRHFRNLRNQELELPSEGVALIGDNAQGKSNFLEAIYYLETLRSFRGARDAQMVSFGDDVFRVVGTTQGGADEPRGAQIAAAFQKKGKRKKVSIDGVEPDRLTDALGHFSAVIFSPADVDLVSGGPSERRRFLDIVLALNEPGYVGALSDYKKSLIRRNAALKARQPTSLVSVWDQGLVRAGAEVMVARRDWIMTRADAFDDYYARVSGGRRARMTYRPNVQLDDTTNVEAAQEAFREALLGARDREERRGVTLVGPHRDDLRLHLCDEGEELDLRDYGSGGQRRTAALALRLVEAMTIRERRSRRPMILLDDVFAELDGGRSERILELMEGEDTGQVVLTAPKEADVRLRRDALPRWRIQGGEITT
ncbi:MAG: DNA replication/repair protein RecF [Longimicrobiales bacterium]|nr:DNA replication/repair protein RecF [Longimicrobiales bacterium]